MKVFLQDQNGVEVVRLVALPPAVFKPEPIKGPSRCRAGDVLHGAVQQVDVQLGGADCLGDAVEVLQRLRQPAMPIKDSAACRPNYRPVCAPPRSDCTTAWARRDVPLADRRPGRSAYPSAISTASRPSRILPAHMRCPRPDFIGTDQPTIPDTTAAAPTRAREAASAETAAENASTPTAKDTIAAPFVRGSDTATRDAGVAAKPGGGGPRYRATCSHCCCVREAHSCGVIDGTIIRTGLEVQR